MLAEPAGRAGITCEKCRQSLREESVKPTEGHKAFEKCGGIVPREVTDEVRREVLAEPAGRAGITYEKCRQSLREESAEPTGGSREVTTLIVTESLFSLRSNPSRRVATLPTHLTLLVA